MNKKRVYLYTLFNIYSKIYVIFGNHIKNENAIII